MDGCIEPDMFSAAVRFWTRITPSRRQKAWPGTTRQVFGSRNEQMDIMTALAAARLVIIVRFTPPGLSFLPFWSLRR
ncbi:hypothetical protein CIT26_20465 [Mesorhizobium temperatum]|uniref:Uncharacterized protein n=1 Tax=Mesorhizobium temperatum TaxID=241416 RepID=A0A271LHW2_9HYPH|nr:hypothetical protein CIT26_20465 [Mesorhizobium temperatum]